MDENPVLYLQTGIWKDSSSSRERLEKILCLKDEQGCFQHWWVNVLKYALTNTLIQLSQAFSRQIKKQVYSHQYREPRCISCF